MEIKEEFKKDLRKVWDKCIELKNDTFQYACKIHTMDIELELKFDSVGSLECKTTSHGFNIDINHDQCEALVEEFTAPVQLLLDHLFNTYEEYFVNCSSNKHVRNAPNVMESVCEYAYQYGDGEEGWDNFLRYFSYYLHKRMDPAFFFIDDKQCARRVGNGLISFSEIRGAVSLKELESILDYYKAMES